MRFPFEADFADVQSDPDPFVDSVFDALRSDFMTVPRGDGFLDFATFDQGYEALKQTTAGFDSFTPDDVLAAVDRSPVALIVVRTMLGFSPSEWACITREHTGVRVDQGYVRSLDRSIRTSPATPLRASHRRGNRLAALVATACALIAAGADDVGQEFVHRLDKADTRSGLMSVRAASQTGVPYSMLLYERFLGRPFASHRDSVSELVGAIVEIAVENRLTAANISYRKTGRAERIEGFDQAPDFVVPNEFNPKVVIEAKLSEDDGTARDKVTRIQHLAELAMEGVSDNQPRFEVIACIAGRGFSVRREDMKKLLLATRGKVFTLRTVDRLIDATSLASYASSQNGSGR